LGIIALAGAVGGVINALLSKSSGLAGPYIENGILQLGALGNVIVGAFAAVTTWGLYGPLKDAVLLGSNPGELPANLTVTSLVGAALAGAGGARIIASEIDKMILKKTAVEAAKKQASPTLAAMIASSGARYALNATMNTPK
jgi:hypothetical protein